MVEVFVQIIIFESLVCKKTEADSAASCATQESTLDLNKGRKKTAVLNGFMVNWF